MFYAAPQTPEVITVLPLYDQNGQLNLTVKWMQQVSYSYCEDFIYMIFFFFLAFQTQSLSDKCSFHKLLNYTVVLKDSTRERVEQKMINSDNCNDDVLCSISFILSSPDQNYFIDINVAGAFGSTSTSLSE